MHLDPVLPMMKAIGLPELIAHLEGRGPETHGLHQFIGVLEYDICVDRQFPRVCTAW